MKNFIIKFSLIAAVAIKIKYFILLLIMAKIIFSANYKNFINKLNYFPFIIKKLVKILQSIKVVIKKHFNFKPNYNKVYYFHKLLTKFIIIFIYFINYLLNSYYEHEYLLFLFKKYYYCLNYN